MSPTFLSLPTELLLAIILQADSIGEALQFLTIAQRPRAVWMENSDLIIKALAPRRFAGYDESCLLARDLLAEAGLPPECPPVLVAQLLSNEKLASAAVQEFDAWVRRFGTIDNPPDEPREYFKHYYFLRRLVGTWHQQPAHAELLARLDHMEFKELQTVHSLSDFMSNDWMSYEAQQRHSMLVNENLTENDMAEFDLDNVKEEWHVADDAITAILQNHA